MSNTLYQVHQNLAKIRIPDQYEVIFGFNKKEALGKTDYVRIVVRDKTTEERTSWVFTTDELRDCKMDFIKENIEAMIESLEEDE